MAEALKTHIYSTRRDDLSRAAQCLADGGLVAFPSETVYGLGADATNDESVARVFEAKNRPTFNPLIVHVSNTDEARILCLFDDLSERLAAAFWPGPLTLVLPLKDPSPISKLVTNGGNLCAIRVPDHQSSRDLIEMAATPIAAPSANPSGRISPTTADHVLAGLDGRINAVVDGGHCPVGLESTIFISQPQPTVLRLGGVPLEVLENCLDLTIRVNDGPSEPVVPGQLKSHYAPRASLRLNALDSKADELLIGFGKVLGELSLSQSGDLIEAAAALFDVLHAADATARPIAVAPIPQHGLGRAINDRLQRAAAPRE